MTEIWGNPVHIAPTRSCSRKSRMIRADTTEQTKIWRATRSTVGIVLGDNKAVVSKISHSSSTGKVGSVSIVYEEIPTALGASGGQEEEPLLTRRRSAMREAVPTAEAGEGGAVNVGRADLGPTERAGSAEMDRRRPWWHKEEGGARMEKNCSAKNDPTGTNRVRRLELEGRLRARQAEDVILQNDLAKCRETIRKVEQERDPDLARHRQEILDQQSEIEHMSGQLGESLARIEEVKQERHVMEMARNSEQMRRLELEERFRARQAEAVVLQKDLEQARGRCSELEAELQRTKANEQAQKDEEIANRNAAREEGRDDMLTEMIQLLNSKRANDRRAKQAEKDRVEKERAEKMRKTERELGEELERSRCMNRDEKYRNARIWTDALAFDRFETILLVEEFTKIKFCDSKPLTFEALPWPVLARPGTYAANHITADHIRAFFRTPVATSANSATHPIPAEYRKHFVKQGLLAFHGDKMVARISTVEDDALRQQILEAANIVTQTLNEIVIFHPFSALRAGYIVRLVLESLLVGYTGILVKDNIPPAPKMIFRYTPQQVSYHTRKTPLIPKEYNLQIAWNIVIELALVLVLWGLTVINTELLIALNHIAPEGGQQPSWQFGQVLPMFLVILPLANLITAFQDFGLKPLPATMTVLRA
ncbi:hypothetical protein FB451DRAFT_1178672 [Mycena latifolia]|nr:hypothetical protein FB451DRAFT_1178672 [Mycena latifolia]